MASPYGPYVPTPIATSPPNPIPNMAGSTQAERIKRHEKFYLSGGDVIFLVQSNLFRVHRYFFERESSHFREKLGIPAAAGQPARGSSDANPLTLDDVRSEDFERFLWVFYNPKYSIYEANVDEWESILKLAYEWRFNEVKKLCCRELEKYEIEPVRKISMYQLHELDKKLLISSYAALTLRADPLTFSEGKRLGLETALLLATARECARAAPSSGGQSPTAANCNDEVLVGIIRQIFGLEPGPPSPDLTPIDRNVTFAATPTSPRRPLSVSIGSPRSSSPTGSAAAGMQSMAGAAEALEGIAVGNLIGSDNENAGPGPNTEGTDTPANDTSATGADAGAETENTEPPVTPAAGPSTAPNRAPEESKEEKKTTGEGTAAGERAQNSSRPQSPAVRGGNTGNRGGGKNNRRQRP